MIEGERGKRGMEGKKRGRAWGRIRKAEERKNETGKRGKRWRERMRENGERGIQRERERERERERDVRL